MRKMPDNTFSVSIIRLVEEPVNVSSSSLQSSESTISSSSTMPNSGKSRVGSNSEATQSTSEARPFPHDDVDWLDTVSDLSETELQPSAHAQLSAAGPSDTATETSRDLPAVEAVTANEGDEGLPSTCMTRPAGDSDSSEEDVRPLTERLREIRVEEKRAEGNLLPRPPPTPPPSPPTFSPATTTCLTTAAPCCTFATTIPMEIEIDSCVLGSTISSVLDQVAHSTRNLANQITERTRSLAIEWIQPLRQSRENQPGRDESNGADWNFAVPVSPPPTPPESAPRILPIANIAHHLVHDTTPGVHNASVNPSPYAEVLYYIYTAYYKESGQVRFLVSSELGHLPAPLQTDRLINVHGYTPDEEVFALKIDLDEGFGLGTPKFVLTRPSHEASSAASALSPLTSGQHKDQAVLIIFLPEADREELDQLPEVIPNSRWTDRLPGLRITSSSSDASPPYYSHIGIEQTIGYLAREAHSAYGSIDLEVHTCPLLVAAWPALHRIEPIAPERQLLSTRMYDALELSIASLFANLTPILPCCEATSHLLVAQRLFCQITKGDRSYEPLAEQLRTSLPDGVFHEQLEYSRSLFREIAAELQAHPGYGQCEFGFSLVDAESFQHILTTLTTAVHVDYSDRSGVYIRLDASRDSLEVHSITELALAQSMLLHRPRANSAVLKASFGNVTNDLRTLLDLHTGTVQDMSPLGRAGRHIGRLVLLALNYTAGMQILLTATVDSSYALSTVYRSILPLGLRQNPTSLREFFLQVIDYRRGMVMAYPSLLTSARNRLPIYDPLTESRALELFAKRARTAGRTSQAPSTGMGNAPSSAPSSTPAIPTPPAASMPPAIAPSSAPSLTPVLPVPSIAGTAPAGQPPPPAAAPSSEPNLTPALISLLQGFEERFNQSLLESNRQILTQVRSEQQGLANRLEEVRKIAQPREPDEVPVQPPLAKAPRLDGEPQGEPVDKHPVRDADSELVPRRLQYEAKKEEHSKQDVRYVSYDLWDPSAAPQPKPSSFPRQAPPAGKVRVYGNVDRNDDRRSGLPRQEEDNSLPNGPGKQPGDIGGDLEDPDEHIIRGENGKALVLVHFLVRQHRGPNMDSHVLVSKATPSWKAKFAPHFELVGSRPTFDFTFFVRAFSNWFHNRTRGAPAMSQEELNQCVGMLAAAAVGQNNETPPYKFEPAVEGVTTARHHWFVNVDIPPKQPQESLDPRMRREGPRDVILFDKLFSDLFRSPCDGEQGYSAFSFITSDALIEDYTVTAQNHFHIEDTVGQGRLNVINAMGKTHQWWCQHRRLAMIGASADPNRHAEASRIIFQQHLQRRPPPSQKDAHYLYQDLKFLRDRGVNESLRSYTTVLIPWVIERSWQLYQVETSVREDAEEIPVLNMQDHERAFSHQPSLLVRYVLHKIANDGKNKKFVDWLSVNEIAEKLSSLPARGVAFPGSFEPPLLGVGSKSDQFVDAVKRTLLVLRCYEAHGNGRELIELVNHERRIAYAYFWEEGETVREWSNRLIRQVKAPGLTIDLALLGEDEKRGLRQCLNGYFTLLTDKIKHARMRELYRHLVLYNPHYRGMAATLEVNPKVARAVTMSQHIGSTRAFADILTDTCGYLQDMDLLQKPLEKPPLAISRPYDGERSQLNGVGQDSTADAHGSTSVDASADGGHRGRAGNTRKRRVTIQSPLNSIDAGDPGEEEEEESDTSTSPLHALGESLKDTLKPLASFGPGLQELVKAMNGLNARCGSLDGKIAGLQGDLQLHHEQRGHDAQRRLNVLSDNTPSDHSDHEHGPGSSQTLMALQRQYPPRFNNQPGSTPPGAPTMGRGNNLRRTPDVLPSELHKLPQNERPYHFYHPQTNYQKLWPEARAGLKKVTGIDGPNHPKWNELDVTKLPGGHCGSCGSKRHTDGWCDSLWSQQDDALKSKGDLFVESRRQRLTWNKPAEAQLASLSQAVRTAPSLAEGISAVVNSETLAPLLEDHPDLAAACDSAKQDHGTALYSLLSQWEDPRVEA